MGKFFSNMFFFNNNYPYCIANISNLLIYLPHSVSSENRGVMLLFMSLNCTLFLFRIWSSLLISHAIVFSVLKPFLYCIALISCSFLPVIFLMQHFKYGLVIKVQERNLGQLGFISAFPADGCLTFSYAKCIVWFAFSSVCLIYTHIIFGKKQQNYPGQIVIPLW